MRHNKKMPGTLTAAALATVVLGSTASAQSLEQQVAELTNRVETLEAEKAANQGGDFKIGPNTTIDIYGYAKADFILDLDADLGNTIFGLADLAPGTPSETNFRGHAFQSRLGIRTNTSTDRGDFKVNIEGDFFGGGGGDFRLRQAFGEYRGLLAGQTWTNFMPIDIYPSTLDFQGPAGIPFARQTQLRYTFNPTDSISASVSLEDAVGVSGDPVLTGAVAYSGERFYARAALLGGTVDFNGDTFDAFGVNLAGRASLWQGGAIVASYTQGEAISSYMVFGGDDVVDIGGTSTVVEATGITVGLTQAIGDRLSAGVTYGLRDNDQGNATDTEELETLHLTLNYQLTDNLSSGVEYIIGERTLFDGSSADADRLQASIQFNF